MGLSLLGLKSRSFGVPNEVSVAIVPQVRGVWPLRDPRDKFDNKSGGLAENRTRVQGFAVLCVTTPPSGLAGPAFGGSPRRLSTNAFDEWRRLLLGGARSAG